MTVDKSQQRKRITEWDLHKQPILELLDAEYEINALDTFKEQILTIAICDIWTVDFLGMKNTITNGKNSVYLLNGIVDTMKRELVNCKINF